MGDDRYRTIGCLQIWRTWTSIVNSYNCPLTRKVGGNIILTNSKQQTLRSKTRQSNFELLRIVSMLMIVFYHSFYHLKIGKVSASQTPFSMNLVIGYLLGSWGLVGVGCFFLLSAHFLIGRSKSFGIKKILRLILQVIFWSFIMLAISIELHVYPGGSGTVAILKGIIKAVLSPFSGTYWFITAYIFMYILYPFMNYIIDKLSDTFYRKLIIILTIIVPLYTFCRNQNLTSCDLGIAVYYYLLCGYLKRNPNNFFERHAKSIFWVSSLLTVLLEIMCNLIKPLTGPGIARLQGRNSVFAIITAISLFYIFKNLKIKPSTLINVVAKGTLGVYLFHESVFWNESLWNKLLNLDVYFKNSANYILVYICSVLLIYFVATVIDLIRLNLLEKPLFSLKLSLLERLFNKFDSYIKSN
jgi:hypothetical protein